ncbi:MAG: ribosomal protein S18-alanine N-acetyltransferase [Atribacterota bacterium]
MAREFLKRKQPLFKEEHFQIIPMQLTHLSAVLAIEQKSFPQPWSYSLFLGELSNRVAVYFVALLDWRVIGYIGLWIILDEAHITTFAIHPSYRKQGYGKKIFRYALDYTKMKGCQEILLEVRITNVTAQELYQHFGFTPYGTRKHYYNDGEDALLMKKIHPVEE